MVSLEAGWTAGQDAVYPYVAPVGRGRAGLRGPESQIHL